jgi:PEP-CTERM motif
MRTMSIVTLSILAVCMLSTAVRADWDFDPTNPDWKMHWPQLPDLTPNGMDVLSTPGRPEQVVTLPNGTQVPLPAIQTKYLADDWRCTETGTVRDIHIWGSWLYDIKAPTLAFDIVIYTDKPAGAIGDFSHPLDEVWRAHFEPGEYAARIYEEVLIEQFYDPNTNEIIGTDTVVWQYNFFMDDANAFWQDRDTVYWLSVQPLYPTEIIVDPDPGEIGDEYIEELVWGWKTTNPFETDHFNDDAVFWDVDETGIPGPYNELRYPMDPRIDQVLWEQSIDLSFVITPEPATMGLLGFGLVALVARRKRR